MKDVSPESLSKSLVKGRQILVIQGHPDESETHLCHALADAYISGAHSCGHTTRQVSVAKLDFPLLRSQVAWERGVLPVSLQQAQDDIGWAEHIVFIFPLWLGDMPALLKGFLEQVVRPGFAFKFGGGDKPFAEKALTGRSARVVVTMNMPAVVYRVYYRAHSVKSLERNILRFCGISPVRQSLIGQTASLEAKGTGRWLQKLTRHGQRAD